MNCKNASVLFMIFLIFSFLVCFIPQITDWDIMAIKYIQSLLINVDKEIPIISGGILFYIMTCIPLCIGCLYFLIHKMYRKIFLFGAIPFLAYFINSVIKIIVRRPRPPVELHFEEHMSSYSYISRHTFLSACLWGIFIYIVCKYCKNKILKYILITISVSWILFEGFTRVWMGVHNPTDVIGALLLSLVFIIFYIRLTQKVIKV